MNRLEIIGNLTRDAEVFTTSSGKYKVSFSVAVGRKWSRDDEPATDFFNCIWWGETANKVAGYLKKGKKIFAAGEHLSRTYTTDKGETRTVWELNVRDLELLSPKETQRNNSSNSDMDELLQESAKEAGGTLTRGSENDLRKKSSIRDDYDEDDDIPF